MTVVVENKDALQDKAWPAGTIISLFGDVAA
jgi:hypothetical protein